MVVWGVTTAAIHPLVVLVGLVVEEVVVQEEVEEEEEAILVVVAVGTLNGLPVVVVGPIV
jgi:hypothetical protein